MGVFKQAVRTFDSIFAISSGLALCFLHVHHFDQWNEFKKKKKEKETLWCPVLNACKQWRKTDDHRKLEWTLHFLIMRKEEMMYALFS